MWTLLKNKFSALKKKNHSKFSYSQTGEDMIVDFIFSLRSVDNPSYLDIGAYHPQQLSNTYFFYKKGGHGINVEPNPENSLLFKKLRPRDKNFTCGIGVEKSQLKYFAFSDSTLNTFDADSAINLVENFGKILLSEHIVEVLTIHEILQEANFSEFPDFLSLDVEGLDLLILESIDFTCIRRCPKVICVETIEYTLNGSGRKNQEVISFLEDKNYILFADTFINSIFVHKSFWVV